MQLAEEGQSATGILAAATTFWSTFHLCAACIQHPQHVRTLSAEHQYNGTSSFSSMFLSLVNVSLSQCWMGVFFLLWSTISSWRSLYPDTPPPELSLATAVLSFGAACVCRGATSLYSLRLAMLVFFGRMMFDFRQAGRRKVMCLSYLPRDLCAVNDEHRLLVTEVWGRSRFLPF